MLILMFLMMSVLNLQPGLIDEPEKTPDDFELQCLTDGSVFRLHEHRGKLVVLHFLLKTECPYCLKYTRDYTLESQKDAEVVHLFIKPDSEAELRAWIDHLRLEPNIKPPLILKDTDAALAKKYNVPDGYAFHGQIVHFPAMIVLDHSGQEQFRYVGKSNSDRYPVSKFQTRLNEWKRSAAAGPGTGSKPSAGAER